MNFIDLSCPVCGMIFNEYDDVVVCPDCGAPHHRACYNSIGHCHYDLLHIQGFEWKDPRAVQPNRMPVSERPADQDAFYGRYQNTQQNDFAGSGCRCNFCGSEIAEDAQFCNFCGRPVIKGEIDGISVTDWSVFLGRQAPSILAVFKNMDLRKKKTAFYIPLLFVPEVFLLHKRLWIETLLYEIIGAILALPSFAGLFYEGLPFLGISASVWNSLVSLSTVILLGLRVVMAMYGLWYYRQKSQKKIKRIIETSSSSEEVHARLVKCQPTMTPLWILLAIYVLYLFTIWNM